MDTTSLVTMPENDNTNSILRKPEQIGFRGEKAVPKSAFSDLSNCVPRSFRPGTHRKATFTVKQFAVQVPQENYMQFPHRAIIVTAESDDRISPIQVVCGSKTNKNTTSSTTCDTCTTCDTSREATSVNSDGEEDVDYPEPERFHPIQRHDDDLDDYYYSSQPLSTSIVYRNLSYDIQDYDIAEELNRHYRYKDDVNECGLSLSPVDEREINTYVPLKNQEDESDAEPGYPDKGCPTSEF